MRSVSRTARAWLERGLQLAHPGKEERRDGREGSGNRLVGVVAVGGRSER